MKFRQILSTLVVLACAGANAQNFPSHPIRIVVPYPAGGTADAMARILQEPFSKILGQPVVVDNKGGAAGAIGSAEVARATPDGHTLVLGTTGPHSVLPSLSAKLPYHGLNDFAPVSLLGTSPLLLVVGPTVPAANIGQFIAFARASKQPLAYSSSGIGSFSHLAVELFAQQAKLEVSHVPYKGNAPATTAVASGEVAFAVTTPSAGINAFAEAGKIKILGVTTLEPSSLFPGAPAISSVVPGFDLYIWYGVLAPAKTDPGVIRKLNAAVASVLSDSAGANDRYRGIGVSPKGSTPAELTEVIRTEIPKWADVVRRAGITRE